MRIVLVSDAHLDARTSGIERFDEIRESFEQAVAFAVDDKARANLFVFCGDLCDSDDGRDVLRAGAYVGDVALRLRSHGIPSLWLAGNHDVVYDGRTTAIETLLAIESSRGSEDYVPVVVASSGPKYGRIIGAGAVVLGLPYAPDSYDAGAALLGAAAFAREHRQRLLVFHHLMLPGMHPGSESAELARGKDRAFPLDAYREAKPLLTVGGHYHRHQKTPEGIVIVGALARLTHGEEDNTPGYVAIDVDTKRGCVGSVEHRPVDAARLLTVGPEHPAWADPLKLGDVDGAFVRLDPPHNIADEDVERLRTMCSEMGAVAIKVKGVRRDAVVPESNELERKHEFSPRGVVESMVRESRSRDAALLADVAEDAMREAGL
jgi:DNA repair exonuclease SbcCD nuclease subunit